MSRTDHLSAGEIDVWLADVSAMTAAPDSCLRLLDDSELGRYRRLRTRDSQVQYAVGHALLRRILSRYADIAESNWQFAIDALGRPRILEPSPWRHLQFNLSHTHGLVACAVGVHCRIGLDVENIFRPVGVVDLARHVLAEPELASLAGTSDAVRSRLFFQYWTLKESYMKATGRGLSIPPDAFWFDLTRRPVAVTFSDRCRDDAAHWRFRDYAVGSAHQLAVAVSAPLAAATPMADIDVRLRWTPVCSAPPEPAPLSESRAVRSLSP
jgi:4'-phosphopantetheinyl transferase